MARRGTSDGTTALVRQTDSTNTAVGVHGIDAGPQQRLRHQPRKPVVGKARFPTAQRFWFVNEANDTVVAYTPATRARNISFDISLGFGNWQGGSGSDGTTIWFVNLANDTAVAYTASRAEDTAQLVTGGSTYTTTGDADGYVSETLTGISNNQSFVFTLGGGGFAEVFPQL